MDLVAVGPTDEALLLDLLNTTPVVDGVPRDDLGQSKAARSWMGERGIAPTDQERVFEQFAQAGGSSSPSPCDRPLRLTAWTGSWR